MPMDEKLHIVQHLYGEGGDPAELQRLLEDEALREEYAALSETKRALDQRQRARPDPLVIDRIVAAAATPRAGVIPGKRQDRRARPRARRYRLAGALSGVLALALVVSIGLNQYFFQGLEQATPAPEATAFDAPEEAEAVMTEGTAMARNNEADDDAGAVAPAPASGPELQETLATAQPTTEEEAEPARRLRAAEAVLDTLAEPGVAEDAALAGVSSVMGAVVRDDETTPTWDEADDLMRVHRRLEMLRARSRELIWDESAVMSLDSLPAQPSEALPGLEAAGKKQQPRRQR